ISYLPPPRALDCSSIDLSHLMQLFIPIFVSSLIIISAVRVKKASRSSLDKVRELINDESARRHSSIQSDSIDFFADIRRDPREARHHDELTVNNVEDYFQGDVDLSENQVEVILRNLESTQLESDIIKRTKRKVGKTPLYKRWKRRQPISFEFASEIPPSTRNKIRNAMRLWQANTCIRFEENGPSVDRLEFFDGGGCSSFVGRIGGTQGISISTPGCDVVGIISHEIGHALGIFHEQARPDQERHVSVNYNNIPISRWNNFQPVDDNHADLLGLPYDTGSVMHYGPYGFSSDPYVPTIRTLDRNLQKTIGQRAGPSFLDFQAINLAYECTSHCKAGSMPDCQRGGYVHPNNCSTCICPDGLAGTECANIRLSNGPCGGVLRASQVHGFITSPNYPNDYLVNTECYWMIQAPVGGRVFLEIDADMEFALCEDTCDKSYVEVKYNSDLRLTGARFCCPGAPRKPFVSFTNEMLVLMRGFGGSAKGFRARFWTDAADPNGNTLNLIPSTRLPPPLQLTSTMVPPLPVSFTLPTIPPMVMTTTTTRSPETTTRSMLLLLTTASPPRPPPIITPATTTTPSTTEEKLIPVHDCGCDVWTEWQGKCSQQCGGCGSRQRKRVCIKDETCQTVEKRPCNFDACPEGTNFLLNNGEVHLLWRGCCIGLFRQGDSCAALEANSNPLLSIISELLKTNDAYGPQGSEPPLEGAAIRSRKRL
ncbi:hypothetical protein PMAYCL1PPCAC_30503, partial [Pristionchus mayeri]